MQSARALLVFLLAAPVLRAQDAPPAPAADAPAATPPADAAPVLTPTAEPAASDPPPADAAPAGAPVVPALTPPTGFDAECWRVGVKATEPLALVPDAEQEAQVEQAGFGAITRRAAYNALGMDDRLAGTQARQDKLVRDLRFKKVAIPLAVGALAVVTGLVLGMAAVGAVVLWLLAGSMRLPVINNDNRTNQTLSYLVWITAAAGLPLALLGIGGGLIPLVLSGLKAVQLRNVPDSPLLDQTGFTANEAAELAAAQNAALAKRLGLTETPVCKGP